MVTLERGTKTVHHNLLGLLLATEICLVFNAHREREKFANECFGEDLNMLLISTCKYKKKYPKKRNRKNDLAFALLSYKCFNLPSKNIDWEVTHAI